MVDPLCAELVEASNPDQMIRDALDAADIHYDNYAIVKGDFYLPGVGKCICRGTTLIDHEPYRVEFIAGTHKDTVYEFGTLEVIITPVNTNE